VAIGLNSLAGAEHLSGDDEAAERDYAEALRIARTVDYPEGVAYMTGNLAMLASAREDWLGAEVLAREALSYSENIGRQQLIASHCYRLANALMHQSKKAEALPYVQRAVQIYARLGSPEIAASHKLLAECES
jgi:tetratricopeptide (TPR) repeat protein